MIILYNKRKTNIFIVFFCSGSRVLLNASVIFFRYIAVSVISRHCHVILTKKFFFPKRRRDIYKACFSRCVLFNRLPRNLGLMSQLQSINMDGNRLSFVRQDIIRGGTDRMMKFLRDRITEEILAETRLENEWPDKYALWFKQF